MQAALQAVPGVAEAKVEFDARKATVTLGDGAVDPSLLVKALEAAGYGGKVVSR